MLRRAGIFIVALLALHAHGYRGNGNNVGSIQSSPQSGPHQGRMQEIFSWNQIDFLYPTPQARQQAIARGDFDQKSVIPIGVAAAGNRVFLSMPRWYNGVPATLATASFPSDTASPLLKPYPNWEWSRQGNCDGITSVFRVKVDECNRLWVLDTGVVNSFVQAQRICTPQVVVFDLKTDKMLYRHRFPDNVLKSDSLLVTMEVEYPRGQCGPVTNAILYVADVTTFALIVVDIGAGTEWRVQDKTMYPTPEAGTYDVNNESFELMDGVLGLALSPRSNLHDRKLYYHAMSGFRQRWVQTRILRNQTSATSNPRAFQSAQYMRQGQAAGCSMDQNGVMFFGMVTANSVACWNTNKPFSAGTLVPLMRDDRRLQFVATTTVDPDSRLWSISNRLQKYIVGTMNPQEVNYRVFMAPSTATVVQGTACERGGHGVGPTGVDPGNLVFRP